MRKNVLVIEGGGANGLLALGAIDAIIMDRGVSFDVVFGTSIGGAIGLALTSLQVQHKHESQRMLLQRCMVIMSSLKKKDVISLLPSPYCWTRGGLFTNKVGRTFGRLVCGNMKLSETTLPVFVGVTDIDAESEADLLRVIGPHQDYDYRIADLVAMTTNVPGLMAGQIDPATGHRVFDGGVGANNLTSEAFDYIAERGWSDYHVYIIRLGAYEPEHFKFLPPGRALYQMFNISMRRCEYLSMKISGLYRAASLPNFTTINLPSSAGLINFNPKTSMQVIEQGFNLAKLQLTQSEALAIGG